MKKLSLFLLLLLTVNFNPLAAQYDTKAQHDARMQWWRDARFGMFIHWGLYAVPAGEWKDKTGYGEWIRTSAQIPLGTYDQFAGQFNPVNFNAEEWVKMAKDAGMRYIVITSKHHDGFCMFGTKQTGFNILSTPFQRDPMKELAAACKKYDLKFCFYYSIMDWHHPDYLPRRDWEKKRSVRNTDFRRYILYMKEELKELLTNYGEIGVLWFDGEWESTWNETFGKEIYDFCRTLQPGIIINNRVGAGRLDMEGMTREGAFGGDFGTPEQQIPATGLPGSDWETCMTMNDHWGYNKLDKNFKSSKELIRMLTDIASKGGNYLLNVGPTALGQFPQESTDRLKEIGNWMKVNGESVYQTEASPFSSTPWGRCTKKNTSAGGRLYLHVFEQPKEGLIRLDGCLNEPVKAWLLADPKKNSLKVERQEDALLVYLPETLPDTINTVVVLDLKGKPDLTNPPGFSSEFDQFIDSLKVTLKTDRENVEIRYTLDGKDPVNQSPLYSEPVFLKKTLALKTRCFRKGKPVSGIVQKTFTKVAPLPSTDPAASNTRIKPGLRYKYYEGDWDSLPGFSGMKARKEGTVADFSLDPRKNEERFAFVFSGFINVPETAMYSFFTDSDDGSRLFLDGNRVVDNDLLHGMMEKEGSIPLSKGFHTITVEYFEKTGGNDLKVSFKIPGQKKIPLPSGWLFH